MPFTLSHPAAILPLRSTRWPVAALAAGSMAPDLPYFIHLPVAQWTTHSIYGLVTIDLAMAMLMVAAWHALLGPAAYALAPDALRTRIAGPPRALRALLTHGRWRWTTAACLAGGLTHIGWDAFTHENRWGVRQIAWLSERHGIWDGYAWAQYLSSLAGAVILAVAAWRWWRRTHASSARAAAPPSPVGPRERILWTAAVLGVGGAGMLLGLASATDNPSAAGFRAATWGGSAAGAVALMASAVVARRRG